ncbi:hypothetical protein BH20ACI3_BH20ACI3_38890 [soil metagenome]
MVTAGLSSEVIMAKIKVSRCNFDTDPSVLAELKHRGVPDDVLLAMVEAPDGAPKVENAQQQPTLRPRDEHRYEASSEKQKINKEGQNTESLPVYGNISELKNLTKLYVVAESDESLRMIIKALSKAENFHVVNDPADAEIFLVSGSSTSS